MRKIAVALMMLSMFSCAAMMRDERRETAKKKERWLEANLKPGLSGAELKEQYYDPDQVEFHEGHYFWIYDADTKPLIITMDNDKVSGWYYDRTIAQGSRMISTQREANKIQQDRNNQNAMRDLGNAAARMSGNH